MQCFQPTLPHKGRHDRSRRMNSLERAWQADALPREDAAPCVVGQLTVRAGSMTASCLVRHKYVGDVIERMDYFEPSCDRSPASRHGENGLERDLALHIAAMTRAVRTLSAHICTVFFHSLLSHSLAGAKFRSHTQLGTHRGPDDPVPRLSLQSTCTYIPPYLPRYTLS